MIMKWFYHLISGILFGNTIRHKNIIEAIGFCTTMRYAVCSLCPIGIAHNAYPKEVDEYLCIDYGLIFSASRKIQRYIVAQGGVKIYLQDDEYITTLGN